SPTAPLANRQGDLVARPARVLRPFEGDSGEKQDGLVVIERLARVATDFRHRFAKRGHGFAREVEAEDMALEVRVRNVVREATRTMTGDELLDLPHGPSAG